MNMRKSLGIFFGVLLGIIFGSTSISAFSTSEPGVGLLYKAIEIGEMEKAKELLADIDVNTQDFLGYTPLYKAVFYNRVDFVKYLFELGANANLSDVEGLGPIHVATLKNLLGMIKTLKDKGADIEAKDKYGYTPLHLAADQGSLNTAKQLIYAGANVNSRSEWGGTPLHASVAKKKLI